MIILQLQQQQTIVLINDPIYPEHSIHSSFTKTFRKKQEKKTQQCKTIYLSTNLIIICLKYWICFNR